MHFRWRMRIVDPFPRGEQVKMLVLFETSAGYAIFKVCHRMASVIMACQNSLEGRCVVMSRCVAARLPAVVIMLLPPPRDPTPDTSTTPTNRGPR